MVAHDGVMVVMMHNDGGSRGCSEVGKGEKMVGGRGVCFLFFLCFSSFFSLSFMFIPFKLSFFFFLYFSLFFFFFFLYFFFTLFVLPLTSW
jgi:hypothetical protein